MGLRLACDEEIIKLACAWVDDETDVKKKGMREWTKESRARQSVSSRWDESRLVCALFLLVDRASFTKVDTVDQRIYQMLDGRISFLDTLCIGARWPD
jgi:hypothetical protein